MASNDSDQDYQNDKKYDGQDYEQKDDDNYSDNDYEQKYNTNQDNDNYGNNDQQQNNESYNDDQGNDNDYKPCIEDTKPNTNNNDYKHCIEDTKPNTNNIVNEGPKYIRLRGLPWSATHQEILNFLKNVNVINGSQGIYLVTSRWDGKNTGEAYVELESGEDVEEALKLNKASMGHRYIEVFTATSKEAKEVMRKTSGPNASFVVKLRGLPYAVTEQQIEEFFNGLEIKADREGILFVMDRRGRATGEAFVQFESQEDTEQALGRNREKIGHRYIEIFRSSLSELKRSTAGNGRHGPYDLRDRGSNRCNNDFGGRGNDWGNNGGFGVGANNMLGFNNLPSLMNSGNFGNANGPNFGNNSCGNFGGGSSGNGNFGNNSNNNFGNNSNFGNGIGNFGHNGGPNFGSGGNFGSNGPVNSANFGNHGGPNNFSNYGNNRFNGNNGNFGNDFGNFNNFGNNRNNCFSSNNNFGNNGGNFGGNNGPSFSNNGNFGSNNGNFGNNNFGGGNFGPIGMGPNNDNDYFTIHMRGLPYSSYENDVFKFFEPIRPANVRINYNKKGLHNGTADAYFETYEDAQIAMKRHRDQMGSRYIELFYDGRSRTNMSIDGGKTVGGGSGNNSIKSGGGGGYGRRL